MGTKFYASEKPRDGCRNIVKVAWVVSSNCVKRVAVLLSERLRNLEGEQLKEKTSIA